MLHGDDPCLLPDGTDAYAHAKKLGRFKMVSGCRCCVDVCVLMRMHTRQATEGLQDGRPIDPAHLHMLPWQAHVAGMPAAGAAQLRVLSSPACLLTGTRATHCWHPPCLPRRSSARRA